MKMEVREYPNAGEFLKMAEGFLLEHEAENNLILGQAGRMASDGPAPGSLSQRHSRDRNAGICRMSATSATGST